MFLRKVRFPSLSALSFDSAVAFLTQSNLIIGVTFSGLVFLLYIWVLSKYETSSVVPAMLGINLVVISLYSVLFFGEAITLVKFLAYSLIFSGVILLI